MIRVWLCLFVVLAIESARHVSTTVADTGRVTYEMVGLCPASLMCVRGRPLRGALALESPSIHRPMLVRARAQRYSSYRPAENWDFARSLIVFNAVLLFATARQLQASDLRAKLFKDAAAADDSKFACACAMHSGAGQE